MSEAVRYLVRTKGQKIAMQDDLIRFVMGGSPFGRPIPFDPASVRRDSATRTYMLEESRRVVLRRVRHSIRVPGLGPSSPPMASRQPSRRLMVPHVEAADERAARADFHEELGE